MSGNSTIAPPEIWIYRNGRDFLAAHCEWRKNTDPRFSFRKVAKRAGLSSPNYIQRYLSGERQIREATAAAIADALRLKKRERDFFVLLVRLETLTVPEEQRACYEEVLRFASVYSKTGHIDAARLAYFTEWYIPVIHTMASLAGFRPDPHWIAARIEPRIRSYDAKRALDTLFELGIFAIEKGHFVVREPRLETSALSRSIAIREYHRAMIGLSLKSIDIWDHTKRTTCAMTVTVPKEAIPELLAEVESYREQLFKRLMLAQADDDEVEGEVIQINFQAFPVTHVMP